MWRRRTLAASGGLIAAGLLDRALAPQLKPLSTAAAAAAVGTGSSIGPIRMYQYAICPFCNKVKSLLDLYQVPYETVDVNPLTKKETKSWSGGYRKVPITLFGEEQVNDSPVIATRVMDELEAAGTISKADAAHFRSASAIKWAEWSDKEFAVSDPAPLHAPGPHCTQWPSATVDASDGAEASCSPPAAAGAALSKHHAQLRRGLRSLRLRDGGGRARSRLARSVCGREVTVRGRRAQRRCRTFRWWTSGATSSSAHSRCGWPRAR
jgi:glutaredoxin